MQLVAKLPPISSFGSILGQIYEVHFFQFIYNYRIENIVSIVFEILF